MADVSQYKSYPQVIVEATSSGSSSINVNGISVLYFQLKMKCSTTLTVKFYEHNGLVIGGEKQYTDITKSIYDATNFKYNQSSFVSSGDSVVSLSLHIYECHYEEIKIEYEWSGTPVSTDYFVIAARKI